MNQGNLHISASYCPKLFSNGAAGHMAYAVSRAEPGQSDDILCIREHLPSVQLLPAQWSY